MKVFERIDNNNIMYAGKHYQKVLADDRNKPQCNRCVFNTDPNEVDEVCLEIGNSNCDCANGEYWIEDTMEIQIPEGCEVEKVSTEERKVVVTFKAKKPKYPRMWKEYCATYPVNNGEYSIDEQCCVYERYDSKFRDTRSDKLTFKDCETAEAVLALCQLIQLRECYNQGWKPDWNDNTQKHTIEFSYGKVTKWRRINWPSSALYFKSEELRDLFLENFRDLIEKIKPLYGIMKGFEE